MGAWVSEAQKTSAQAHTHYLFRTSGVTTVGVVVAVLVWHNSESVGGAINGIVAVAAVVAGVAAVAVSIALSFAVLASGDKLHESLSVLLVKEWQHALACIFVAVADAVHCIIVAPLLRLSELYHGPPCCPFKMLVDKHNLFFVQDEHTLGQLIQRKGVHILHARSTQGW